MSTFQTLIAAVAAVALFLYALGGFSRELRAAGGAALTRWLRRVTTSSVAGFTIGAGATALVQSSSAITALAVTLVDAGAITFRGSLGILLGANVGTTVTAWLVSLKLTGIGPAFIVLGTVVSIVPLRVKIFGQALFYFGLIFFSLELVSGSLHVLRDQPVFMAWLARADHPLVGALFGVIFTAVVQSSSVTTGLAILFVQQGLLPPAAAIPIVIGANLGTTSTGLVASVRMDRVARATAVTNFLFNAAGVLVLLPFLGPLSRAVVDRVGAADAAVAWAHLGFNLGLGLICLLTLRWWAPPLARRLGVDRDPAATAASDDRVPPA